MTSYAVKRARRKAREAREQLSIANLRSVADAARCPAPAVENVTIESNPV